MRQIPIERDPIIVILSHKGNLMFAVSNDAVSWNLIFTTGVHRLNAPRKRASCGSAYYYCWCWCYDDVGNAAPRPCHVLKSVVIELAGDVEVVVLLVGFDGGYEGVVEVISEVARGWRVWYVTQVVEVVFDVDKPLYFWPGWQLVKLYKASHGSCLCMEEMLGMGNE
ncbi:dipeptidase [Sesbania bispinosa]|nr:dipeptidase [Sesbania bispinosa]